MHKAQHDQIRAIVSGKGQVRHGAAIQTVAGHLRAGTATGQIAGNQKQIKEQETEELKRISASLGLWVEDLDLTPFVSQGAEQKVYLNGNSHVLKLNDAIYYGSWADYFTSLLLHNYFFSDTAYELKGFTGIDNVLYAIVEQPYVHDENVLTQNGILYFIDTVFYLIDPGPSL
jgi:hypothetical protein